MTPRPGAATGRDELALPASEALVNAAVLSNGEYAVLVTESGGGGSFLRGFALTRWQPDPLATSDGMVLYLRDFESAQYWLLRDGERGGLRVLHDAVEQWCEVDGLTFRCTTRVAKQIAAEMRTISVSNHSGRARRLDLTTFAELALNDPAADAAHPAFSKLFVQTDYDHARNALIAWRRRRSPEDRTLWVAQRLIGATEVETDRARFIGRARMPESALALNTTAPLSSTTGTVLDPAFAMRVPLQLGVDESVELEVFLCAADTRSELEAILDATDSGGCANCVDPSALGLPARWLSGIAFDLTRKEWHARGAHFYPPPHERTDYGAFSSDGAEYVLHVDRNVQPIPQPWINVIANEQFGFLVSERGGGYTWAANSRENRLTPFSNDAVSDRPGEVLLIRDDHEGSEWSLLPGPASADVAYEVRYGFGYARFRHETHALQLDVCLFVPRADPVKITRIRIKNGGDRRRELSLLSLGSTPADTRRSVETSYGAGIIFATNRQRGEFSGRVAFALPICERTARQSATGSRRSFVGRDNALDETFGAELDPCAALQLELSLDPGAWLDCAFLLGEADDEAAARALIARYASLPPIDQAYAGVTSFWRELLGRIHVQTPAPALDLLLNGWLAYQNLACRMWARSAFYQPGGAFGFRDQLQDAAALLYLDPMITRRQILLHAAHQFVEGDVLHWWHPPLSKGIRTRFADDLLWLPYITLFYVQSTGDRAILDEPVRFLRAETIDDDEAEIFVWPREAPESAALYEHCCRTLDRSLTSGAHGLPLMGVGDWNDGMNRVGGEGRGESVWLGFFLFDILRAFLPVCLARNDRERAERYTAYLQDLAAALNDGGWDGAWYRRAYYDNGAPLGSAQSDECRIDALAQAWAVLSRAAPVERAFQALQAVEQHLVAEEHGLIRLLTPAFDHTPHDPGYIKGYVPGVRENGGQYTHAALWAVRALAELGLRERAAPLLEMLSPVTRAQQPLIYQGEPYAVAADVYGEPPHVGRAGWTWYTGSAGWMYRVYLESVLGFELRENAVRLRPCVPSSWAGYTLRFRHADGTRYTFEITVTAGPSSTAQGWVIDGAIEIPLLCDRGEHVIRISAGPDVVPRYEPSTAPLVRTTSE
jgi:N,N'-diacetylchitobiose phosphorylase